MLMPISFIVEHRINLRPPAHPFEAFLLYDRNQLKRCVIGGLKQRITCVFKQFRIYDNIAEKGGGVGGLKDTCYIWC